MTTAKNLRIPDYLQHILQAITQIETYAAGVERTAFFQNKLLQDGIIRNIEIIGEAANNILRLDSEFDKKYPSMALKAAYAMRNALAHGYFLVDPVLVWGTVQTDIPALKEQAMSALEDYTRPST
jgi:uncharacterized protein with HEPN domain